MKHWGQQRAVHDSTQLQVLYDDPDTTAFTYGGGQDWDKGALPQWYGLTTVFPDFAFANLKNSTKAFGTLTCHFEGVAVTFVGNTPGAPYSQSAIVSIDGGDPYSITYPGGSDALYIPWYKTPTLPSGKHNVSITNLEGTALDYAIVDVGLSTNLTGRTVVVDDDNPEILYSGSGWARGSARFDAGYLPDGKPFGNGTHETSDVGDKLGFQFYGSQIRVYGIFNWARIGVLGVDYTLDDTNTISRLYPVAINSSEYQRGANDAANFLLFSADMLQQTLTPDKHTLVVTITQAENVKFTLDFITYTPAYDTLEGKPALDLTQLKNSMDAAHGNPDGHRRLSKGLVIGLVVGSVVGVIALSVLGFLLWCRRRQRKKQKNQLVLPSSFSINGRASIDYSTSTQDAQIEDYYEAPNSAPVFPLVTVRTNSGHPVVVGDVQDNGDDERGVRRVASESRSLSDMSSPTPPGPSQNVTRWRRTDESATIVSSLSGQTGFPRPGLNRPVPALARTKGGRRALASVPQDQNEVITPTSTRLPSPDQGGPEIRPVPPLEMPCSSTLLDSPPPPYDTA